MLVLTQFNQGICNNHTNNLRRVYYNDLSRNDLKSIRFKLTYTSKLSYYIPCSHRLGQLMPAFSYIILKVIPIQDMLAGLGQQIWALFANYHCSNRVFLGWPGLSIRRIRLNILYICTSNPNSTKL